MDEFPRDMNEALMLDGNAAAGVLQEVFGAEMTANPARCAHCGQLSMLGALLAFGGAMGAVLRCPYCGGVVMRLLDRPEALWLDLQGATHLRLMRNNEKAR